MKNSLKTLVVSSLIVIAVIVYSFFALNKSQISYKASTMSKLWPIYTNNEYGFHVKYPDVNWSVNVEPYSSGASFTPDGSAFFSVNAGKGSSESPCADGDHLVLVNGFSGREKSCTVSNWISGGPKQDTYITYIYLEKNGFNYTISFTQGKGSLKDDSSLKHKFNEMIGTFGFNQVKSSDSVTYVDPRYNISIQYPKSWSFGTGDPALNLHSPEGDRITVGVAKNTSFDNLKQSQGGQISDCGLKKEYSTNKNIGQLCKWLGYETYFFEKNSNVYSISLDTLSNNKNDFDSILNSFTF